MTPRFIVDLDSKYSLPISTERLVDRRILLLHRIVVVYSPGPRSRKDTHPLGGIQMLGSQAANSTHKVPVQWRADLKNASMSTGLDLRKPFRKRQPDHTLQRR